MTLVLLGQALSAHVISVSYAEIEIGEHQICWLLKVPVPELDLLLGLDENHDGTVDAVELQRSDPRIREYILSRIAVRDNGREARGSLGPLTPWKDAEGHPFLATEAVFEAPGQGFGRITLRCDLLRGVVAAHQTIARIRSGGQTREFVFEASEAYEADARPSGLATVLQFVRMGVMHILTGYDHLAFLFGVVLIGGSFKAILKVVTSFTVAHSITLGLAAFEVVNVPSRLVESGIALSIMYIALENLLFKSFDARWIVTFFFGLIHGFGFASALHEVHLTPQLLATALFSFNLGVEVGQVCIVAALLPALLYLSKLRFNDVIVKACSLAVFAMGSFWFWERAWGG